MEFEKVRDVIVETLGCEAGQVTEQATLEELGADSLAAVELIMAAGWVWSSSLCRTNLNGDELS